MTKPGKTDKRSNTLRELLSWIQIIVVTAVVAFVLNSFLIANSCVPMGSMENTIIIRDRVIGSRLSYHFGEPKRGDVITLHRLDDEKILFVKRIIGMPDDKATTRDGHVYLNDPETPLKEPYIEEPVIAEPEKIFQVPEGTYFYMGDNHNKSMDARYWKSSHVHRNEILAKVLFHY